ncbi:16S rRNA (guanine(527)-N(7))-methyltransferase RsmG [Pseudotabrizicola algicola]|uniref:Ribosomal RNA small subunit methyltransferase G n=1 Tax=Pseudotabrizicola algicola TaxID=2709381 RepID=A0A6B3RPJ8_9RHOB|nr:16S rRNA (guanine(527)-N(7))-methyltransferase RsmG [Pseudotabrizicola algicola]NEX48094.1 16S rRNA (guanine(527)-N(7))-methyltransferase RsmG [Pseudotabrizicola algicola]
MAQKSTSAERIVSRETDEKLLLLERLVQKWNPIINLVSKESLKTIRSRHIDDSMQIFRLAHFRGGVWCDLGSGGGFPGLVVAIMMAEEGVGGRVVLVEADQRKSAFLREAARQLEVTVEVFTERIERVPPLGAAVLSARALAGLPRLCEFANLHMATNGVALFPKGVRYQDEITQAKAAWVFDLTVHQSVTERASAVLEIRNIRHV